jgi:hypothetical protein
MAEEEAKPSFEVGISPFSTKSFKTEASKQLPGVCNALPWFVLCLRLSVLF